MNTDRQRDAAHLAAVIRGGAIADMVLVAVLCTVAGLFVAGVI